MSQRHWDLRKISESIGCGSSRARKTPTNRVLVFFPIILIGFLFATSCGKAPDDSGSANFGSSQGNGTVDNTLGFAVTGVANNYPYVMTQQLTTSPSSDVAAGVAAVAQATTSCAIPTTTTTPTDYLCIANVNEGDLYVHGMALGINVPTSMCEYFWSLPYYYYALRPGTIEGDEYAVHLDVNGGMVSCSRTNLNGQVTAGTAAGSNCTFPDGEVTITGSSVVCAYDYEHADSTQPNCCEGSYSIVTTQDVTGDPPAVTSEGPTDYGGKMSNCLRGPAMMNSWPLDNEGYPEPEIVDVSTVGKNYQYQVPAPIATVSNSNLLVANMFDWAGYEAGTFPSTLVSNPSSIIPKAIEPLTDLTGSPVPNAHPYYEYRCLDRGFETLDRIRLLIASWTTTAQLTQYLSTGTATLNVSGTEGAGNCIGVVGPCDDELGWDDLSSGVYPGLPF